jgi:hypothetical protein
MWLGLFCIPRNFINFKITEPFYNKLAKLIFFTFATYRTRVTRAIFGQKSPN